AELGDRAGVAHARPDPQPAVLLAPLRELADAREVDDRLGALAAEVEVHHHIRAAPQGQGLRMRGLGFERLVPRARLDELHHAKANRPDPIAASGGRSSSTTERTSISPSRGT